MLHKVKIKKIGDSWQWSPSPGNWFYGGTWANTVWIVLNVWLANKGQTMKPKDNFEDDREEK